MKKRVFLIKILFLSFFSEKALPSVYSDEPYFIYEHKNARYIFSKESESFLPFLIRKNINLHKIYEKEFDWVLDEKEDIVLMSSRNQMTNGYASVLPQIQSIYFNGAPGAFRDLLSNDWIETLLIHEGAHIYQMGIKGPLSSFNKKIIGNTLFAIFPVPSFIYPNMITPTFLLEGSSVFNESRFQKGGRLFSGTFRSHFINIVKTKGPRKKFPFFNETLSFPLRRNYIMGGYFFEYLSRDHSVEKIQSFFKNMSDHYLMPFFAVKKSFQKTFGVSFDDFWEKFLSHWEKEASKTKTIPSPILTDSFHQGLLNRTSDKIFFLTSDGFSHPKLHVYDLQEKKLKSKTTTHPFGKVFFYKGNYYTRSSLRVDLFKKNFSLFDEKEKSLKEFEGKFVYDLRENKKAFSPINSKFLEVPLHVDEKKVSSLNSEALLDEKGNVYFFKQDQEFRVLYKNKTPILRFKGYDSTPLDVDKDGNLYFLAPKKQGSGIYVFQKGKIFSVHPSSLLFDGKLTGKDSMLVSEITPQGFHYKLISFKKRPLKPFFYEYSFDKKSLSSKPEVPIEKDKIRSYEPMKQLKLHSIRPNVKTDVGGIAFFLSPSLSDTLRKNALDLLYVYRFSPEVQFIDQAPSFHVLSGTYKNKKTRLIWGLDSQFIKFQDFPVSYLDSKSFLEYVFLENSLSRMSVEMGLDWRKENSNEPKDSVGGFLGTRYEMIFKKHSRNYEPFRQLSGQFQCIFYIKDDHRCEGRFKGVYTLPQENTFKLDLTFLKTKHDSIPFNRGLERIVKNYHHSKSIPLWSHLFASTLTFKKAFLYPFFYDTFPAGVRRFIPFLDTSFWKGMNQKGDGFFSYEFSLGLEGEFLLSYKQPLIAFVKVSINQDKDRDIRWGISFPTR